MGTELPVAAGYPARYISRFTMRNPTRVVLRPIRPDDEPLMVKFHATLSKETVYLRYFHMEKLTSRVAHERLIRKYFIDYRHEMALEPRGKVPLRMAGTESRASTNCSPSAA